MQDNAKRAPERNICSGEPETKGAGGACRRAYYRVTGMLPIRVSRLAPEALDTALYELSMPSLLAPPLAAGEAEDSPLLERLRRIEEKLDLLLSSTHADAPRPLGAEDLELVVFSGSGLSLAVDELFDAGDTFRVEILLPAPYARLVRGVGVAIHGAKPTDEGVPRFSLALRLDHMNDEDRDALVAYSYDLQRVALRARDQTEDAS